MPLIIVTGLPCSGKSTVAKKIRDHFLEHLKDKSGSSVENKQVKLVSDGAKLNSEGRYNIYQNANREKELRGWLKTETSRLVNQGHIVILDAACYIKGFRYELYCLSKEAKTQYCVVECHPPVEECRARNDKYVEMQEERCYDDVDDPDSNSLDKESGTGYDPATFDALVQRYEKCNDKVRWDSPLFSVTDLEAKDLDMDGIFDVITKSKPLIPNKSTAPPTCQPLNFFQELESTTTKVIEAILKFQKMTGQHQKSTLVAIPGTDKKYLYSKAMTSAQLGRLKRQFIAYTKLHPIQDGSSVTELFVQYLNSVNV